MIISYSTLLTMRNISKCVEKIKIHILGSIIFFFFENCALYETRLKNVVEPDWPQKTI